MGQFGLRYSWSWSGILGRHNTGGDLYPVLLLLWPYLADFEWRVVQMDAIGPGDEPLQAAMLSGSVLSGEELLLIFADVKQVIDGRIVGTAPNADERIEIEVVRNSDLDIVTANATVIQYFESLFGPPLYVSDDP